MTIGSLRELDIVKAFVLFALGSAVGGFIVGAIGGMLVGVVVAATGGDARAVQLPAMIVGGISGIVVGYYMFRTVTLKILAPKLLPAAAPATVHSAV